MYPIWMLQWTSNTLSDSEKQFADQIYFASVDNCGSARLSALTSFASKFGVISACFVGGVVRVMISWRFSWVASSWSTLSERCYFGFQILFGKLLQGTAIFNFTTMDTFVAMIATWLYVANRVIPKSWRILLTCSRDALYFVVDFQHRFARSSNIFQDVQSRLIARN